MRWKRRPVVHNIVRCLGTCSFSVCFLYIFMRKVPEADFDLHGLGWEAIFTTDSHHSCVFFLLCVTHDTRLFIDGLYGPPTLAQS